MNNIDKLFRNKLDSHEVIPSKEAWQKLNGQLNQNKSRIGLVWMSVAAAVTLVIVSIAYFNNVVPNSNNKAQISKITTEQPVVENENTNQIEESNTPTEGITPNTTIQTEPETITSNKNTKDKKLAIVASPINKKENKGATGITVANNESIIIDEQIVEEIPIALTEENKTLVASNENISKNEISQHSSMKITYNLQPVVKIDSSVFTEKEIGIDSKSGVLGKIVAFAKNAKATDVSLGQLRAAKDDLLSFDNLKSGKQTQNK
jgi:hypothetical protein